MCRMFVNQDLVVFFVVGLSLVASIVAFVFSFMMHMRVNKIFRSANSPDIERLLKLHTKTLEDFVRFQSETTNYMKVLNDRIKNKMGSASTLRFNPFQGEGIGGNHSFSSVFADEEGNGVVVTGMHLRERTNIFAKPIKNWQSEYELSEEEKTVIQRAINDRKNGNK